MRLYFSVVLSLAIWLAIGALPASADVLKVDFGATGQQVMSYFSAFTCEADPAPVPPATSFSSVTKRYTYSMSTDIDGKVGVTVSTDGGNLDFRNRTEFDGTNPIWSLIRDHVKPEGPDGSSEENLYLTFADLKEGKYTITTYHHDAFGDVGSINVLLDDKDGHQNIAANVSQSYRYNTPITILEFDFCANGEDSVKITFDEIAGVNFPEAVLNGFELTPVPEPKAIILLVSGIACLAACGRWRQKRLGS